MSRVLMVDDAGLFQMLESSFLRRLGCEIVRAADGAELVAKAGGASPDLILLDAERTGCDTPGCLRALKADPALRAIPVLVITSPARVADCAAAGADATLVRPLQAGALELALSSLGRVTHRRGPRRPVRLSARVAAPTGSWRGRVKDISRSGLFLALPQPPPVHAAVEISLRLPGPPEGRHLNARGVVVRQVPPDPESHLIPGVGVRFTGIDPASESILEAIVGAADKDGPPGGEPGGGSD